jgi:serine/threonine-protein kinase
VPGTQQASLSGTTLDGRYELLEPIGSGGVGDVYRARLLKLDRLVAVKVLHEALITNANFVERFQREARAISRMHHPHCVAVLDFGVLESRPYLVLEYLPGQTVTRLLEGGPFAPARAIGIALQLLDALTYFHGQSVIHRDLKSENLMLVPTGATRDFLKVLDFGMAKILDTEGDDSQLNQLGLVAGTLSAMAPEQLQQARPDNRIDIYATGILLFEMIVGRRPFRASDPAVVARMQLETAPPRPRDILGEAALSAELESVILRALEKNRANRFDSAEQMAEALHRTPEGKALLPPRTAPSMPEPAPVITVVEPPASSGEPPPVVAAPTPEKPSAPSRPAPLPVRSRRWLLAGAAACAVALLAWVSRSSLEGARAHPRTGASASQRASSPAPAEGPPTSVSATATPPPPPPAPAPAEEAPASAPVPGSTVPWIAHRDLAVVYASRGDENEAFREVKAALEEDATAAAGDPALLDAAVAILAPRRVPVLLDAFRSNDHLVEALAEATAKGKSRVQRHAALWALSRLRRGDTVDLVAMRILDFEQATSCSEMRTAFNKIRTSTDPRVTELADDLRERAPTDRHARCLRAMLHRQKGKPQI